MDAGKYPSVLLKGSASPYIAASTPLSLSHPQQPCAAELCFHSWLSAVCRQRQRHSFQTGELQELWSFKACEDLSELLSSADLLLSAHGLLLQALPDVIPDGHRDTTSLQRAHAKISIQAPDRLKRVLEGAQIANPRADCTGSFGSS